jgi:glycogen(starch) synthase
MKLLLYSHFFAPSVGGVETIVLSLAHGLAGLRTAAGAREFELTLVTQTPAANFDDRLLPFKVVRQPGLAKLWQLLRAADVIHVAGPALAPLFLGFLARKPVAVEHHGYQAICLNGLLVHQPDRQICPGHFQARRYAECLRCQSSEMSRIRSWANLLLMFPRNFFVRRATANIAVTEHVLERQALPHSVVILHGIEDLTVSARSLTPSTLDAGRVSFGYVGRFVAEKGIELLLDAAHLLKEEKVDFEINLIGDGPERTKLEAKIARYQLESCVRITGFLTGAALSEALHSVRVIVMPSVWEETAGLAAMEQMMRGRLVIAAQIGGLGEVVSDSALTFPPGNAQALADCMRKVLRDPSLIDSLGAKARARSVTQFSLSRMIDEHAALYRHAGREGQPKGSTR